MSDLREIYQQIILDHYRKPRNYAELEGASHHAGGHNPLCGDRVDVYLDVEEGIIRDIGFKGAGCAISTASASLMTEAIKGMPIDEAKALFDQFHTMLTDKDANDEVPEELGKLEALSGVRQLPVRIKCATLAWHTLQAALQAEAQQTVSTE